MIMKATAMIKNFFRKVAVTMVKMLLYRLNSFQDDTPRDTSQGQRRGRPSVPPRRRATSGSYETQQSGDGGGAPTPLLPGYLTVASRTAFALAGIPLGSGGARRGRRPLMGEGCCRNEKSSFSSFPLQKARVHAARLLQQLRRISSHGM